MKRKNIIIIACFLIISFVTIFIIKKYINATNDVEILTKNAIFDIISSIEDSVISCISTDGDKHLNEENKLDTIVLYILKNKEKYIDKIEKQDSSAFGEYQCLGRINANAFLDIGKDIFHDINYNINEYRLYDNGYINLYIEPFSYNFFDRREMMSVNFDNNNYEVIIKYIRALDSKQNKVYIKYILDYNLKIKDVIVLSSILD